MVVPGKALVEVTEIEFLELALKTIEREKPRKRQVRK
jgi:hypothetical protein